MVRIIIFLKKQNKEHEFSLCIVEHKHILQKVGITNKLTRDVAAIKDLSEIILNIS